MRHRPIRGVPIALLTLLVLLAGTVLAQDGWETEWSRNLGVSLLAQYDSSGPAAWDPAAHPLVFITTMGPGYSGLMSGLTEPGVVIIDATTKEVVASAQFGLEGVDAYFEPHGLGVSPDGQWIYLPTGASPGFGDVGTGRLMIINARTLKLDKVLATPTNPHHAKAFHDTNGTPLVLAYTFREGGFYVLDPAQDNRIVGGFPNGEVQGRGYLAFTTPDGRYMLVSVRPPRGIEGNGSVAVIDTTTWRNVRQIDVEDSDPIWVAFSGDATHAYVTGGHDSIVVRIHIEGDPRTWEVDGISSAAAIGPYGVHPNWDDTELVVISKGEATHNRGISVGVVNPTIMRGLPYSSWAPGPVGEFYTGCMRGDHGTLHPDPDLDELWITCNGSFEVVVWDNFTHEVKARIPVPNGGSTHSGAFVQYEPNGDGMVLSDQNGLHGPALEAKLSILGLN